MGEPIPLSTERAYHQLKRDVLNCTLAPGSELSETELCAEYSFTKAVVRVALTKLAHDGLIRVIPRRGYMVLPVTVKDIHDLFELRLLLEPAAARMAAGKVNTQRLKALDETCRVGYQPGDAKSTTRFLEANKAFHVTIAQASGNARLANAIERLLEDMTRLLHLGLRLRKRPHPTHDDHKGLVNALARGNAESAERICREQLEASRNMVLAAILTSNAVAHLGIAIESA